jgi:hypothetical protein
MSLIVWVNQGNEIEKKIMKKSFETIEKLLLKLKE